MTAFAPAAVRPPAAGRRWHGSRLKRGLARLLRASRVAQAKVALSNDRAAVDVHVGVPGSLVGVVNVIDGRRADAEAAVRRPGGAGGASADEGRPSFTSAGWIQFRAIPECVVTALAAGDGQHVDVRCDECGFRVGGISGSMRHWDAVWALVAGAGWAGSPGVDGPHACPRCAGRRAGPGQHTAPARFATAVRWRADLQVQSRAAVVEMHGDLDISVRDQLQDVLGRAGAVRRDVVLDLAGVPLIDSTGLGLLVRAHQRARRCGGRVCLAAPSRFVVTVLHTMRLESVFPIFDDRAQALHWLATRSWTAVPMADR